MAKKQPQTGIIEKLFAGIIKTVFGIIGIVVLSFILLSGNISLQVSFNKDKTSPASFIEKAGKSIALVRRGYDTVNHIIN